MKKILLLLLTLICSVAANAATEVTDPATQMVNGTIITLQCMDNNGGDGYYFDGATTKSSALQYSNFYQIVTADGGFYLQRVSDGKYLNNNSNSVEMVDAQTSAAVFTFSIATVSGWTTVSETNLAKNGVNTVRFTTSGTYLNTQAKTSTPKYATGTGGYSIWDVYTYSQEEVDEIKPGEVTATKVAAVADLVDGHIYTFNTKRNALTWDGSSTTCVGATLDAANDNHKFVAYKYGTTGRVYLYNVGAQQFASKSSKNVSLTDTPDAYWTIKTGGNDDYPLMIDSEDANHFNFGGSGQITVDSWSTADDGNRFEIMDYGQADETLYNAGKNILLDKFAPKTSTLTTTYYYNIKNFRSGNYANYAGDAAQMTQVTADDAAKAAIWYFTSDGKVHNAATSNLYLTTASFDATGATVYIKENPHNPLYFCLSETEDLGYQKCWDDNNGYVKYWSPYANDYEGTSWIFEAVEYTPSASTITLDLIDEVGNKFEATINGEAGTLPTLGGCSNVELTDATWDGDKLTATVKFPFKVSSKNTTNQVMISSFATGAFKWYVDGENVYVQKDAEVSGNAYAWLIYPAMNAKGEFYFTIKNVGADKYIYSASEENSHSEGTVKVATEGSHLTFVVDGTRSQFQLPAGKFLSTNSSNSTSVQSLGTWSSHGGTGVTFEDYVEPVFYTIVYKTADNLWTKTYTVREGAAYPTPDAGYFVEFKDVPTGTVTGNDEVTLNYATRYELSPAVSAVYVWYALDIHGNEAKYPLYSDDSEYVKVEYTAQVDADDYTMGAVKSDAYKWAFIGTNPFTGFKLYNKAAGKYAYQATDADAKITLSDEGTLFQIFPTSSGIANSFAIKVSDRNYYFNHRGEYIQGWTDADGGSSLRVYTVIDAEGFDQQKLKAQYGTLVLPYYAEIPNGLKVYTCSTIDGTTLELTEETTMIKANTAYLVEGTEGNFYSYIKNSVGSYSEAVTTGLLTGIYTSTAVPAGKYVLQNQAEKGIGFYQVADDQVFTLGANRCYLTAPETVTGSNSVIRISGTVTAIDAIDAMTGGNAQIFDLNGRRINSLQKGINIVNGHKVLVK